MNSQAVEFRRTIAWVFNVMVGLEGFSLTKRCHKKEIYYRPFSFLDRISDLLLQIIN